MSKGRTVTTSVFVISILVLAIIGASIYVLQARETNIPVKVTRPQEKIVKSPLAEPAKPEPFVQLPGEQWMPNQERLLRDMQQLQKRINRLFDESFWEEWPNLRSMPAFPPMGKEIFQPDIDLRETDDSLIVKMDLPGMEKGNIDIRVKDNMLTVKGTREESTEFKQPEKGVYRQERQMGAFEREILLPNYVDQNKINAKYDKGVLTITIKKKESAPEVEGKKITVE
jgi:HSP20 family protein